MNKQYYQLTRQDDTATLYIYGDITSWEWFDSDVSSYTLSRQLSELRHAGVNKVSVHINSYGGEVGEGLAIYNELAEFGECETVCTGFAASISSVIFMAGKKRIMRPASLLMIHNAWMYAQGNAAELRKQADDLDTITNASVAAYMARATVSEEKIRELMDKESWITPASAVEMGLCDEIAAPDATGGISQAYAPRWRVTESGRLTDEPEQAAPEPEPAPAPEPVPEPAEPEPTPEPVNKLMSFFSK